MLTSLWLSSSKAVVFAPSAIVLSAALAAPAAAQSLSLSYKLDPVQVRETAKASPIVNRCSGLTWATSFAAACIAEAAAARVASAVAALRAEATPVEPIGESGVAGRRANPVEHMGESGVAGRKVEAAGAAGAYAAAEGGARRSELPALGSPADARVIRSAGGRENYIANARSVDVSLRLGSKYRMKGGEHGVEVYKFQDVTSENRLHSSGMKNVGIELLVPFQ